MKFLHLRSKRASALFFARDRDALDPAPLAECEFCHRPARAKWHQQRARTERVRRYFWYQ
jgi:hypothetical protein